MPGELNTIWDRITKAIKFFRQSEVKTPLSLIFRVALLIALVDVAILYAPNISQDFKFRLMVATSIVFVVLCLIVCVFAWFRPTHLVYGEAGHRAQQKLEYGTERESLSEPELAALTPVQNKKMLSAKREEGNQ